MICYEGTISVSSCVEETIDRNVHSSSTAFASLTDTEKVQSVAF